MTLFNINLTACDFVQQIVSANLVIDTQCLRCHFNIYYECDVIVER